MINTNWSLLYFLINPCKYDEQGVVLIFTAFSYAQHGGMANAFTSSEHTNYYFDVNPDSFEEALDRYMPFFIFLKYHIFQYLSF